MTHDEKIRMQFEADASPYGYNLELGSNIIQMTRGDSLESYADGDTEHRWLGYQSGVLHQQGIILSLVDALKAYMLLCGSDMSPTLFYKAKVLLANPKLKEI